MKNPFKKEKIIIWHPESPGVKVAVYRNWFQQKIYSKNFATLGEQYYDLDHK